MLLSPVYTFRLGGMAAESEYSPDTKYFSSSETKGLAIRYGSDFSLSFRAGRISLFREENPPAGYTSGRGLSLVWGYQAGPESE